MKWASLVAQMVYNPLGVWEIWVQCCGWEDSFEEGMTTHSSIFAWRIPMGKRAWQATVLVYKESDTTEQLSTALLNIVLKMTTVKRFSFISLIFRSAFIFLIFLSGSTLLFTDQAKYIWLKRLTQTSKTFIRKIDQTFKLMAKETMWSPWFIYKGKKDKK